MIAEAAVAQPALDDDERHSFVGHLDGVGVPQLMGSTASSHPGVRRWSALVGAGGRV